MTKESPITLSIPPWGRTGRETLNRLKEREIGNSEALDYIAKVIKKGRAYIERKEYRSDDYLPKITKIARRANRKLGNQFGPGYANALSVYPNLVREIADYPARLGFNYFEDEFNGGLVKVVAKDHFDAVTDVAQDMLHVAITGADELLTIFNAISESKQDTIPVSWKNITADGSSERFYVFGSADLDDKCLHVKVKPENADEREIILNPHYRRLYRRLNSIWYLQKEFSSSQIEMLSVVKKKPAIAIVNTGSTILGINKEHELQIVGSQLVESETLVISSYLEKDNKTVKKLVDRLSPKPYDPKKWMKYLVELHKKLNGIWVDAPDYVKEAA